MIVIPLIYFSLLFYYFWRKQRHWNLDLAATSLLIAISVSAIIIDVKDLYGDYGINECNITFATLILFCTQWTVVLLLLHYLSLLPIQKNAQVKNKSLYVFFIILSVSSIISLMTNLHDIKEALIMDMADVRNQSYKELSSGPGGGEANYLLLLPQIFVAVPFPTLALFFWFYTNSFIKSPLILRAGLFIAAILQAFIAIKGAGRAAMVYFAFDFYLLYSYFYQYLSRKTKYIITTIVSAFGILFAFIFITITVSRFDNGSLTSSPLDSFYGYAGQHINNFCTMFVHGGDSPASIDREFPLLAKILGIHESYDMAGHYDNIVAHLSSNILVNVFDTFGAEIYLDLGWFGYIFFLGLLLMITIYVKQSWEKMLFYRVFFLVIAIVFFAHGLFAWPFIGHYPTFALFILMFCTYFYKYEFRF